MIVLRLDHVNVRTTLFDETVTFYRDVLGMEKRPAGSALNRPMNCWLATVTGDVAIHVNGVTADEASPSDKIAALDHFAFACVGLVAARDRLAAAGLLFEERRLEDRGLTQLILFDPNGVKVELTFSDAAESAVS